jgi:outer membrane protein
MTSRLPLLALVFLPVALAAVFPASAQTGAAAAPRRLTFREAIELAVKRGPEIVMAGQGIEASAARVRGAGAQRFPQLRAEANVLYWDKALDLQFPAMGMSPGMEPAGPAPGLRVRDRLTSQVTVTLAQPISALVVLHRLIALEQNGVEAARADQSRARLDTAQRASEAYLRLLQARALVSVAEKSVAQVEAQLERARVLEKAGALAHVDVLRLTSARDSARQGLLRARAGLDVGQAGLVLALELPAGTALEVVDDFPDPPPTLVMADGDSAAVARRERPELRAASERASQARAGRAVAMSQLLPNILAVGTYQHTEGQSTFQPKNAWFVGATLSWDLWDWGKRWSGVKEAEARARQAEIGQQMLGDQIAFDAQRRLVEARTAFDSLAVARSGLEAAEEAYRIQSVRYAEGAATTTDVIDAEADVSRARSSYAQSRYDYYLAQTALARAVGRSPLALIWDPQRVPNPPRWTPASKARLRPTRLNRRNP